MTEHKFKTIDIKGKEYVTVNERIKYFNETYPNGAIITNIESNEGGVVLMKAYVTPDTDSPERCFTGYACEKETSGFINKTSFIENCETSAVGRALGMMGIGVDTSIASFEEVANAIQNQAVNPVKTSTDKPLDLSGTETKEFKALKAEMNKLAKEKFKDVEEYKMWKTWNEFDFPELGIPEVKKIIAKLKEYEGNK